MAFVVLCPGTPEGSTGSGSGFKSSQKTGQRLKVSSNRLVLTQSVYTCHVYIVLSKVFVMYFYFMAIIF